MRPFVPLSVLVLLSPAFAIAAVPGAVDLGVPCGASGQVCVPWTNGNFDWVPVSGAGNLLWSVPPGTQVKDFDADGDREIVVFGGGTNARFSKSVDQPAIPGWAKLEFDVESQGGSGNCLAWYDIRVILVGALDPLPFVDTLGGVAPFLPIDYYNDEVLSWYGTAAAGTHMVLDPLQAHITSNTVYPTMTDNEKKVWLAQHATSIWVFYIAADPDGCALDNFVRTLDLEA
jgi:hypothetical protein